MDKRNLKINDRQPPTVLPKHLGLILDGNRRWANSQGLPVMKGHQKGADVLKDIAIQAINSGVPYVSAFVFSTENWQRPKAEVTFLMKLLMHFAKKNVNELMEQNVKLVFLGAKEGLPKAVWSAIDDTVQKTANNTKGVLALCINYGGQQEIVDAVKSLLRKRVDPVSLTTKNISDALYMPEIPALDLIVRTSGEYRLSGFMLWRAAYAELIFVDKHWPDFTKQDLKLVLSYYAERNRRFGK